MNAIFDKVSSNIYDTFADIDARKGLRLLVIVCGYIVFRTIAQRELTKKQLKQQNEIREKELLEKRQDKLVDDPLNDAVTSSFGFGKKTRKRVQHQQKILEERLEARLEEMKKYQGNNNDDDDIADLLVE
ncbi:related to Processing of GAS1 and ALP protein 2 [Saccharomycodes ludwigii]|uniref:Related to Processing of GAS1 and ALP protein 2 n=1 Tax=Saccharomycodes ludwigii TaxID=36035 RepID=A0A376B3Y0_9ASCO|nr:hypothetical protein SCDLUD_002853 [Saccharomycodes ludwigii]KAH3901361.1 hypothetical protein SCDLUD_002853 [Saccharomycodes ludwigii]SSD59383.1 related to Processing of GAS1 and ALP protein 2 [Saccharomycodes ludwigii]